MQASSNCLAQNHYMYELGTEDSENYQWSKLQVWVFFFLFEKKIHSLDSNIFGSIVRFKIARQDLRFEEEK